ILLADGLPLALDPKLSEKNRRALITRNGGEQVNAAGLNATLTGMTAAYLQLVILEWVRDSGAPAEQYRRALRAAEKLSRQAPFVGVFQDALGAAQYRVGRYEEALDSLARSDRLN